MVFAAEHRAEYVQRTKDLAERVAEYGDGGHMVGGIRRERRRDGAEVEPGYGGKTRYRTHARYGPQGRAQRPPSKSMTAAPCEKPPRTKPGGWGNSPP